MAQLFNLRWFKPACIWVGVLFALILFLGVMWRSAGRFEFSMLTQCLATAIILASLRILVGMGGVVSFGHALYVGIGAYGAAHLMQWGALHDVSIPLVFVPLAGGFAGLLIAVFAGWLSVRRSHVIYMAMVTLALCEMVYALAQVWPAVFGDESGLFIDRADGNFLGLDFSDERWVTLLAFGYAVVSLTILHLLVKTPLGQWLQAVRADAVRASCLGMYPQRVRYVAFLISGFFAGIGGALLAIEFETVHASMLSVVHSGSYLMFAYLGGLSSIMGSLVGAVAQVLGLVWLPSVTAGSELYLGLIFIYVVIKWPDGIAGAAVDCWRNLHNLRQSLNDLTQRRQQIRQISVRGLVLILSLAGVVCTVEWVYLVWSGRAHMTQVIQVNSIGSILGFLSLFIWGGAAALYAVFLRKKKG